MLYESEDYFDKQGVSVERAIDGHLNGECIRSTNAKEDATRHITKADLHVLISWLEEVFPIV